MEIVPRSLKPRSERHMFSTSDDNAMLKQIQATHAPDGREVSVKPLISLIEDIFYRAAIGAPGIPQGTQAQHEEMENKALHSDLYDTLELLSPAINKVSNEILCKCSMGGDAHQTTLAIFNLVSNYSWDAKVGLTLAAFSIAYGEFWLLAQLYPTNSLAKDIALLKQLPEVFERGEAMKPKFEALTNLIKAMVDVAKRIVEFKLLPSQYISPDTPEMVTATTLIPTAAYWTVRSIVACASQISTGLVSFGHECATSPTEAWELSSLAHKVNSIHKHLLEQLSICHRIIDEKRYNEAFLFLVRLFETPHIDNMKIIKYLIYNKDDQPPLIEGSTNKKVSVDVLRRRLVLLLISDLDMPQTELSILNTMYLDSRQQHGRPENEYEIVWFPVVDRSTQWTELHQKKFDALKINMPWYYVAHPSFIEPAVIRYIKEIWRFNKKALLVVLDPQAKVLNLNAIHMIWIWGSLGYPFSSAREEALWKEETWKIELLMDSIEPLIFNWIGEGKYIFLYGGEDIGWIKRFTASARDVSVKAKIPVEMLYVGKSNPGEKVRKNTNTILAEGLGNVLPDLNLIWFFWVRLESMWYSKSKQGKSVEDDYIMQETMTMLSFDSSDQCWAVIIKNSGDFARGKAETITKCFDDYEIWREKAKEKGFMQALREQLQELHTPLHCNRLILPSSDWTIPERVVCSECRRPMEKFVMYRCCTD